MTSDHFIVFGQKERLLRNENPASPAIDRQRQLTYGRDPTSARALRKLRNFSVEEIIKQSDICSNAKRESDSIKGQRSILVVSLSSAANSQK